MELDHFGHEHPLVFKAIGVWDRNGSCNACKLPVSRGEELYNCSVCNNFFIHSSCAQLPREMRLHPFHPEHTLTLLSHESPNKSGCFDCHVCGLNRCGYTYHCSMCKVDIDLHCAQLELKKGTPSNNNNNCKMDDQRQRMITDDHPHPLMMICDYKMNSSSNFNPTINCSYCQQPIVLEGKKGKGPIFVCLECKVVLHESCARLLPLKIQHPFHQLHSLTLIYTRDQQGCTCDACGELIVKGFCYNCSQCDLDLHVRCASLMPITNDKSNEGNENPIVTSTTTTTTTTTTTHRHPLIACHKTNNSFRFSCSGCLQPLEEDFIYVCLDCKMILHKACGHLPHRILEHPYHPEHPLILIDFSNDSPREWPDCAACDGQNCIYPDKDFIYNCGDCNIALHSRCALPVAPLVNSKLHPQHPLAFMDIPYISFRCNACGNFIEPLGFRCVTCNFNLHVHCLSDHLPPTFKSKCHLHPLTFTNQPIKDYEDEDVYSEFLCDACERKRELLDPTYYCSECHFVAHVHCILPEILPCLQRESSSLGNELGNMKLDFSMDVIEDYIVLAELDSQIAKLDSLNAELDSKIATRQKKLDQLVTELVMELEAITTERETQKAKLDQLKKTRAEVKHKLSLLQ